MKRIVLLLLIPVLAFPQIKDGGIIKKDFMSLRVQERISYRDALGQMQTVGAIVSPPDSCWRLVYNDTRVLDLFVCSGYTGTINTLFCASTPEECLDEIVNAGVETDSLDIREYPELKDLFDFYGLPYLGSDQIVQPSGGGLGIEQSIRR